MRTILLKMPWQGFWNWVKSTVLPSMPVRLWNPWWQTAKGRFNSACSTVEGCRGEGMVNLTQHAAILCASYQRLTGRELIPPRTIRESIAAYLENAPFALVSHDTQADPVFNYGNRIARELFEMTWDELTSLPSRLSAEPVRQMERARLLSDVSRRGYVDNYSGIRISKSGRRFEIKNATIWNLFDNEGGSHGQAALIRSWADISLQEANPRSQA